MKDQEENIRLIICDDQAIVCEGLSAILSNTPEIELVGVAYNGLEAIELVEKKRPDIVLMDLKTPEMDGLQATKIIHEKYSKTQVIILTTYDTEEWVINAIRNGAAGYILKDTPRKSLIEAVRNTANGQNHIDPHIAGKLLNFVAQPQDAYLMIDQQLINSLTEREREILRLLGRGATNAEIAQTMFLTEGTVKNYVSNLLAKLGVSDRTQAALLAVRNGLGR